MSLLIVRPSIINSILVFSFTVVLQGCSSTPKFALVPEDIATLYAAPQTVEDSIDTVIDSLTADAAADLNNLTQTVASSTTANSHSSSDAGQLGTSMVTGDAADGATGDHCDSIAAEIAAIDTGLGSPARELPPATPPTGAQKTGRYFYDLGVQTVLGQLQIFIQTKRAIFGDNEKERRSAEALERGTTRRAYLIGYAEAANCPASIETIAVTEIAADIE